MRAEFCIFESNAPGLKATFYEPYVDMPGPGMPADVRTSQTPTTWTRTTVELVRGLMCCRKKTRTTTLLVNRLWFIRSFFIKSRAGEFSRSWDNLHKVRGLPHNALHFPSNQEKKNKKENEKGIKCEEWDFKAQTKGRRQRKRKGNEEEGKERGRERGKGNWKWSFGRNGKNRKRPSRESNPGPLQTRLMLYHWATETSDITS